MKNQIQVFENNEFGKLEVHMINGKPYFAATECARILGYSNAKDAILRHCRGVVKHDLIDSLGRKQQTNLIPEGDVYRLIIRSKLPAALLFETWLCDEVIPSIRQYGAYMTDTLLDEVTRSQDAATELFARLQSERNKNDVLCEYVEKLAPKARYCDIILQCDTPVQTSIIAKDFGMTAIAFNKLLHGLRVQYKIHNTWLLYRDYQDKGYTISKTYYVGGRVASVNTLWTQRGRFFLYDFLRWNGILPEAEKAAAFLLQ